MRKAFVQQLTELARSDQDVMLITGDLGFSVFEDYQKEFPKQYFNAGLCEQSMVGMAAGMALEGRKVFVYSIIPFLTYRALEQIRNDLCYQKLPVKLIGVGSGMVYGGLGGTHHGIEDVAVMTSLPGMTVLSPGDPLEVQALLAQTIKMQGPCYMRLNRAGDPFVHNAQSIKGITIGTPQKIHSSAEDVVIFTVGAMASLGQEVQKVLAQNNIPNAHYSAHTLSPVNEQSITRILEKAQLAVVLEEIIERNSFSSTLAKIKAQHDLPVKVQFFNLPNEFTHEVGNQKYLQEHYGLTQENIVEKISALLVKQGKS